MNIPPVIAEHICPHCGARAQSSVSKCWLCLQNATVPNPYASSLTLPSVVELGSVETSRRWSTWDYVFAFLLATCILLTILIVIGMATSAQDRGLLIPFAILVGPAYLVTITRGLMQIGGNQTLRPGNLLLTLFVSTLITTAIVTVLFVAAVVIFFIICITSMGK